MGRLVRVGGRRAVVNGFTNWGIPLVRRYKGAKQQCVSAGAHIPKKRCCGVIRRIFLEFSARMSEAALAEGDGQVQGFARFDDQGENGLQAA